jgi:peptidoglycan/xylan/chitin deacetylase (PgdA/CDA1 family)
MRSVKPDTSRTASRRAVLRLIGGFAACWDAARAQELPPHEAPWRATIVRDPAILAPESRPRTLIAAERRAVALTFDDGPTPEITLDVLAALRARNVKATFFMVGERVAAWPDLVRAVVGDGHEIANHSYSHAHLPALAEERFRAEVEDAAAAIAAAAGAMPAWFRPPYGALSEPQRDWLLRQGWSIAFWTVDPSDWQQPLPQTIAARVADSAHHGSVVLLHDMHWQTAAAVPMFLDALAGENLNPMALSQVYPD